MFIAHLPAGYIVTKKLQHKTKFYKYLWVGLLASILPDLDLFWFYFVDHRQTEHHEYFTHSPIFWLIILLCSLIILFIFRKLNKATVAIILFFFVNLYLHFILDSIVGGINWGYPFFDGHVLLYEIAPRYDWWVFNFILHPTFLLEIAIVIYGFLYYFRKKEVLPGEAHGRA
jgi:inner membrane protein